MRHSERSSTGGVRLSAGSTGAFQICTEQASDSADRGGVCDPKSSGTRFAKQDLARIDAGWEAGVCRARSRPDRDNCDGRLVRSSFRQIAFQCHLVPKLTPAVRQLRANPTRAGYEENYLENFLNTIRLHRPYQQDHRAQPNERRTGDQQLDDVLP